MRLFARYRWIAFTGVALLGLCTAAIADSDYIRVGSFNIANFGDTEEYERSLISLVNFIREMDADVICLQEVEPGELGDQQVDRLVGLLNKAATFYQEKQYEYVIATQETGDEATAFLWRDPVTFEGDEVYLLEHEEDPDEDGLRTFQRIPSYALFHAGNYDFYVVNCHLYTQLQGTSSEGRKAEYEAIVQWLKDLSEEEEKDAIIVGDFNRFLNGKAAWKTLMHQGHKEHFRFPLLEGIKHAVPAFDPLKDEAPEDKYSTTTSKSKRIYDQIIISKGSYNEFTETPEFDVDAGIVPFDMSEDFEWCTDKWSDATKLLSDHRPVWIRLRTDKDDDD